MPIKVLQVEKKKEKDKQYRRDKRQEEAAAKRGTETHNGAKVLYCAVLCAVGYRDRVE